MTAFSASDAALEGFHLLRRRWRVVLGWAGFHLLAVIMLAVVSGVLAIVAAALAGRGAAANHPAVALAGLVVAFGALFAQAIVVAGVLRLEMREEEPGFMHLRLGRDELRLVLVWLILLVGLSLLTWMSRLLVQALPGGQVWAQLLAFGLVVYLGLRFALVAPISFAERNIDFARSWRLTRGRVVALLGMSALSACLIALVVIVIWVVLALLVLVSGGPDAVASLFGGSEALQRHPAVFLLGFAVQLILIPALWVLSVAPLVAAYRAFTGDEAGAAAPVEPGLA